MLVNVDVIMTAMRFVPEFVGTPTSGPLPWKECGMVLEQFDHSSRHPVVIPKLMINLADIIL